MSLYDEAVTLREKVDQLAHGPATLKEWHGAEAAMLDVLRAGHRQMELLEERMSALVESGKPGWCWFEAQASHRGLSQLLDDLLVLRICVQSRIFELEAGAVLAAL